MSFRTPLLFCGTAILSMLAGCGAAQSPIADANAFPFVQCSLKSAGKDVEAATIAFHAKGGSTPKIVSHYDPESTCYRFTTQEGGAQKAGVPEGTYVMTVAPGKGTKATVPSKYTKPESSGLTVEVKKGENILPPFELKP